MSKTLKTLTGKGMDFTLSADFPPGYTQMQISYLLRIADAAESMAKNFTELQQSYQYQKERADRLNLDVLELQRSNSAYRGHITRYKNLYEKPDSKGVKEMSDLMAKNYQLSSENQELTEKLIVLHREYQELYTQLQISKSNNNVKDSQ